MIDDPDTDPERVPELVSRYNWVGTTYLQCACPNMVSDFRIMELARRDRRQEFIDDYLAQRIVLHHGTRQDFEGHEELWLVHCWQFGGPAWYRRVH